MKIVNIRMIIRHDLSTIDGLYDNIPRNKKHSFDVGGFQIKSTMGGCIYTFNANE